MNPSNKPRILRITRPYESVEDYIQSEGWTISNKRMILLDQPRFDRDTIVRFELSLQNGEKLIRAEAKVVGYQTATPDKPGGPKVRFKRFGGSTKAFIQQVVAEHGPGPGLETLYPAARGSDAGDGPPSEAPHSLNFGAPTDVAGSGAQSSASLQALGFSSNEQGVVTSNGELQQLQFDSMPRAPTSASSASIGPPLVGPALERLKGLQGRNGGDAGAPPTNREALLARLRERARGLSQAPPAPSAAEQSSANPS